MGISNRLSLIPWSAFFALLWFDNCRECYVRHGFRDAMFHFLPSFAINGCSATQLPGNITWSFLACDLVPSSMIITICKHWHVNRLWYHFAVLWCETSEVFKTSAFLTQPQHSHKTSKMALDLQHQSRHQSAVFLSTCTALWVNVTQILSAIL